MSSWRSLEVDQYHEDTVLRDVISTVGALCIVHHVVECQSHVYSVLAAETWFDRHYIIASYGSRNRLSLERRRRWLRAQPMISRAICESRVLYRGTCKNDAAHGARCTHTRPCAIWRQNLWRLLTPWRGRRLAVVRDVPLRETLQLATSHVLAT